MPSPPSDALLLTGHLIAPGHVIQDHGCVSRTRSKPERPSSLYTTASPSIRKGSRDSVCVQSKPRRVRRLTLWIPVRW
jgi:hypothetical protein